MRTLALVAATICALSLASVGQDHPKREIFGGYSLERIAPCGQSGNGCNFEMNEAPSAGNFNGWDVSATGYFSKSLGITADLAGHYGSPASSGGGPGSSYSTYTYMFGPTYSVWMRSVNPFVHTLIGGATWNGSGNSLHYNALSWAAGGGVDVHYSPHFDIRLAQFDYVGTRVPGLSSTKIAFGWRFSLGAVFKF